MSHKPLGEVAEYVTVGYVGPSNEYFCENGVPFLRTGNVGTRTLTTSNMKYVTTDFHATQKKSQLQQRDVIVSRVVSNEITAAVVPPEFEGANCGNILIVRPGSRLHAEYLVHLICSPTSQRVLLGRQVGSAQSVINTSVLKAWDVPLLPLPEQQRIADILDRADAFRAKRREALAELDELVQGIFLEMFGDPVTNPRGWTRATLSDISEKITDGEHLNPAFSSIGMPIVMAGNVLDDMVDLARCKMVDQQLGDRFRKKCAPTMGDLLIVSRGATIGRLCCVDTGEKFCLMGSVILVKPKNSAIESKFLSAFLKYPSIQRALYNTSGSSAQQAMYLKDLKRLSCMVPPLSLQREFARRIAAISALKSTHRASLAELDALFASLQDRAFRGELS